MVKQKLLIVGAGGHGHSVAEAAIISNQFEIVGFVDDSATHSKNIWNIPLSGSTADLDIYRKQADTAIVAIGNNALREILSKKLIRAGFELAIVIHPQSFISPSAIIGPGSVVMAGCIVGTEAQIGSSVIVNCGAVVDHHAQIHDYGHLGINTYMAGGSVLGRSAWVQPGCGLGYGAKVNSGGVISVSSASS